MYVNVDKRNFEIDITHDHKELNEWVERVDKTANEICNDPNYNRIMANGRHTGFIIESNDTGALGCLGWAIERHTWIYLTSSKANISENSRGY